MAKKKKAKKRVQHRAAAATTANQSQPAVAAAPMPAVAQAPLGAGVVSSPKPGSTGAGNRSAAASLGRWSYVDQDLRRIGFLVVACIAVELLLWYTLGHTGLGNHVYGLIKH